jgi:hypothetical protein
MEARELETAVLTAPDVRLEGRDAESGLAVEQQIDFVGQ